MLNYIRKKYVTKDGSNKYYYYKLLNNKKIRVSKKEYLTNAVQGISAAKAIKKWLHDKHGQRTDIKAEKVFITGNKWPDEVEMFQIKAFGFDDYNASDFIVHTGDKNFY